MRLSVVSGKETIKALSKIGYYIRDQRGSHVHMRHPTKRPLTVPMHNEIDRGTLRAILKAAEISEKEFVGLL
jgi:predicted RNA binding protein YcfA (HicA-like mRNA interferase family)